MAQFQNGREMWNHFRCGIHYNPMENTHLAVNTSLMNNIDRKSLGTSDYDKAMIHDARSLMMRIKIEDTLITGTGDSEHDHLIYTFEKAQKDNPNIPDIWDLWDGFTTEDHKEIVNRYIGLLDPLTMRWVDPSDGEYDRDTRLHTFNRNPAISEHDPTFCYVKDEKDDNEGWYGIYEYATECYQDKVPSEVWRIYRDIEGY